jgi:hypothetical protein
LRNDAKAQKGTEMRVVLGKRTLWCEASHLQPSALCREHVRGLGNLHLTKVNERMKRLLAMVLGVLGGCSVDRVDVAEQHLVSPGRFFSQNDSAWAGAHLGTCDGATIGSAGAALAATAMAASAHGLSIDPSALDAFLVAHAGYSDGCSIQWAKAADFDGPGGFTFVANAELGSLDELKQHLDAGHFVVVKSRRFRPREHWVFVTGYIESGTSWHHFTYWDPWDTTATTRAMSDGNVVIGAPIHVFE